MKKFNKFLSVAVASAMVMAMAGCGNTDNGSAATGTNAATESAAASDSAASGSVFKIGGIGPTTGGAAVYGLAVQHGAEIAVERSMQQVVSTAIRYSSSSRMTRQMLRNP